MALAFCVLYATCCLIKLSSDFWILMLGRVLGQFFHRLLSLQKVIICRPN